MNAISLRLPNSILEQLKNLSERTGRSKTFYMTEAIKHHIDDLEDIYLAEQRLIEHRAGRSSSFSLNDVEKELGLRD